MKLFKKRSCKSCGGDGIDQIDGVNVACWDCNGGTLIRPGAWQEQRRAAWERNADTWTAQGGYMGWLYYSGRYGNGYF